MTDTQKALKEMMEQYNTKRSEWVEQFGTDAGFNEWFTGQVMGGVA